MGSHQLSAGKLSSSGNGFCGRRAASGLVGSSACFGMDGTPRFPSGSNGLSPGLFPTRGAEVSPEAARGAPEAGFGIAIPNALSVWSCSLKPRTAGFGLALVGSGFGVCSRPVRALPETVDTLMIVIRSRQRAVALR